MSEELFRFFGKLTFLARALVRAFWSINQLRVAVRAFFVYRLGKKAGFALWVLVAGIKRFPAP